jgi:hypothetical protein
VLGVAWRAFAVGLGGTLGMVVGGLAVAALRLPAPEVPGLDPVFALALRRLSGALARACPRTLAVRLGAPARERAGALFALLGGLNSLVNLIEGAFFTTWIGPGAGGTLVVTAAGHLPAAWLLATLFPPPTAAGGAAARPVVAARAVDRADRRGADGLGAAARQHRLAPSGSACRTRWRSPPTR